MAATLIEGVDFTIDPKTGYLVFTREYHLKRGFCCQSGCRHCPYPKLDGDKGKGETEADSK